MTYTVPASTRITVSALKDCWVEAKTKAGGTTLSAKTLGAGRAETFAAPVWLRFGDPTSVRVTAGATALELPTQGPGDLVVRS